MLVGQLFPPGNWEAKMYHVLTTNTDLRIGTGGQVEFSVGKINVIITRKIVEYQPSHALQPYVKQWDNKGKQTLDWDEPGKMKQTKRGDYVIILYSPSNEQENYSEDFHQAMAILSLKYGRSLCWHKLSELWIVNGSAQPMGISRGFVKPVSTLSSSNEILVFINSITKLYNVGDKRMKAKAKIALLLLAAQTPRGSQRSVPGSFHCECPGPSGLDNLGLAGGDCWYAMARRRSWRLSHSCTTTD